MVVADIHLLCVDAKYPIEPNIQDADVCILNRNTDKAVIYADAYRAWQKQNGIWYQIEPTARAHGDYSHEFLDLFCAPSKYEICFENADFQRDLLCFIKKLCAESPKNAVFFVAHLQGYKTDACRISLKHFEKQVNSGTLAFNTVYEIAAQ